METLVVEMRWARGSGSECGKAGFAARGGGDLRKRSAAKERLFADGRAEDFFAAREDTWFFEERRRRGSLRFAIFVWLRVNA